MQDLDKNTRTREKDEDGGGEGARELVCNVYGRRLNLNRLAYNTDVPRREGKGKGTGGREGEKTERGGKGRGRGDLL